MDEGEGEGEGDKVAVERAAGGVQHQKVSASCHGDAAAERTLRQPANDARGQQGDPLPNDINTACFSGLDVSSVFSLPWRTVARGVARPRRTYSRLCSMSRAVL